MSSLRLDWCSTEAALYAVQHWHYSESLPAGKAARIGVWEDGRFIGAILFSRGASNAIGTPYGLAQTEVAELTRVALTNHCAPVSRILRIAILMLRTQSSGLRLLVSYADPAHGHHGGIYQASGWMFVGSTAADFTIIDRHGKRWHSRMVSTSGVKKCFGTRKRVIRPSEGIRIELPGKYKYLMPLDDSIREQIEPLRKPYPKRVGSETSDTAGVQPVKGGVTPTPTLHIKTAATDEGQDKEARSG